MNQNFLKFWDEMGCENDSTKRVMKPENENQQCIEPTKRIEDTLLHSILMENEVKNNIERDNLVQMILQNNTKLLSKNDYDYDFIRLCIILFLVGKFLFYDMQILRYLILYGIIITVYYYKVIEKTKLKNYNYIVQYNESLRQFKIEFNIAIIEKPIRNYNWYKKESKRCMYINLLREWDEETQSHFINPSKRFKQSISWMSPYYMQKEITKNFQQQRLVLIAAIKYIKDENQLKEYVEQLHKSIEKYHLKLKTKPSEQKLSEYPTIHRLIDHPMSIMRDKLVEKIEKESTLEEVTESLDNLFRSFEGQIQNFIVSKKPTKWVLPKDHEIKRVDEVKEPIKKEETVEKEIIDINDKEPKENVEEIPFKTFINSPLSVYTASPEKPEKDSNKLRVNAGFRLPRLPDRNQKNTIKTLAISPSTKSVPSTSLKLETTTTTIKKNSYLTDLKKHFEENPSIQNRKIKHVNLTK